MIHPGTVFQDLRYAARMLRRNAGFTAVAILALALGIGVNAAVLTAYHALVARPLQARNPAEMVNLALLLHSGAAGYTFSYPDYEAYRDSLHSFHGLIATNREQMRLSTADGIVSQRTSMAESGLGRLGLLPPGATNAEFSSVLVVSENYFQVLGVAALRGRTFDSMTTAELLSSPSVLISENFWQKRFGRDAEIVGQTIRLNGAAFKIAGITPRDFAGTFIGVPDFWFPLQLEPLVHADPNWLGDREHQLYRVFGRLAPGVRITQAQAEMTLVADRLRALHDPKSEWAKPATALVFPGSPFPVPLRMNRLLVLTILFIVAAAVMVLAVACADVGSLQLVRARSRRHELETRLSLGASRSRLIRQLLTESALLGLVAGAAAFPFTWALLKLGVDFAAQAFPAEWGTLIFDVTPNLPIFIGVLAISLAAGILFGLAPALESSRSALSSSARGSTSPAQSRRIQDFLVAAQVALSLVLMIAGSMLIRSSINSLKMETGYDSKHVVALDLQFPEGQNYTAARKLALVHQLRTRLAALPGVAAVTSARPPGDYGLPTAVAGQFMHYTNVQSNYFETLGIPVLLGRAFQSHAGESERSIILSESAARQLWPGQNPIGRTVRLGPDELAYQVIGVVRDTRGSDLNGADSRLLYLPLPEDQLPNYSILIRTRSDPAPVMRAIDSVIPPVDPDLVATASTLDEMLRRSPSFITSSIAAAIASSVGLLGLLLALMGIYGTVSYLVLLRTREIGIRMAIGAQKRDILGLILGESARPVIAGLLAGMVLAVGVAELLRGVLYGLHCRRSHILRRRLALVPGHRATGGLSTGPASYRRRSGYRAPVRMSSKPSVIVVGRRVVTLAGLYFPILIRGLDLELAERTVFGRIGGSVADGVLAAHLFLQLVKRVPQRQLAIDMEHMSASVFRHLAQRGVAASGENHAVPQVEPSIHVVKTINKRVGFLRGFDGLRNLVAAALVFAISDQHQNFAPHLSLKLFRGGQINGVIKDSPARLRCSGDRSRPDTADARIHLQPVQARAQQIGRVGVILQQLGILAKADQERQILFAQHGPEKLIGRILFDVDQVHLAGAHVDQQANGERKVRLAIEILDLLFLAVLKNFEVILIKIADQAALLVTHVEQNIDQVHFHFERGGVSGSVLGGGVLCE